MFDADVDAALADRAVERLRGAGVRRRMVSTTCVEAGPRGGEPGEGSVLTDGGYPHHRPTSKVPARRLLASPVWARPADGNGSIRIACGRLRKSPAFAGRRQLTRPTTASL
jgi:hypothetical protein